MKICPACGRDDVPFGRNAARPDGLQAQCVACLKVIQKTSRGRREESARCKRNRDGQRRKLRDVVLGLLRENPCVDCGEADPVVLEFDHQRDKVAAVAELVRDAVALPRLIAEIEKCVVRCANCHRRKTARERGYYATLT